MHSELAIRPGEATLFDRSDEASHHPMIGQSPELHRLLNGHGIVAVTAEYRGTDGRGGFVSLLFTTADGTDGPVFDGPRNLQLKAMFRAMLLARDPGWNQGTGSYGAFRWDIRSNWVTHRHCARSQGRERMIGHGV